MLCVAVSFSVLCVLLSAVQQIVLIAADCIDRNGMERVEVVDGRGKVGGGGADGKWFEGRKWHCWCSNWTVT